MSPWASRLLAALPARPDRMVLPHHVPAGEGSTYAYPTEDDAVVLLPGLAVVVHLMPAEGGRVRGHSAEYHWHHERNAARTVLPNPFQRARHKRSVLYSGLGRAAETRSVVVHYDDADVRAVELHDHDRLVPLSGLDAWLTDQPPGHGTVPADLLRQRLNARVPQDSLRSHGYQRGKLITYQDTWVVHEGSYRGPSGPVRRVALITGPTGGTGADDPTSHYGAGRDHQVAHRAAAGPLLDPFTVDNGARIVVPLPLPPADNLAAAVQARPVPTDALRYSLALLRTVGDWHALRIEHRTIRPELVFPHEDGRTVTLIGAPFARLDGRNGGTDMLRSTVRHPHLAPELRQERAQTFPYAADIWSWASVTVALLCGEDAADNPAAAIPGLPAEVPAVWHQALRRSLGDPRQRPPAAKLLRMLDGASPGERPAAVRTDPGPTAASRVPAAGGARGAVSARPPLATTGARLYQLGPYRNGQERRVAHTLAARLDPTDAVIVAARADRHGRDTDVDCVVLRGDVLVAVECKNWQLPDDLDPAAATWASPAGVKTYTCRSPLPLLRQLAPALRRQIDWPGRSACLLVLPRVPRLTDPSSPAAALLVGEDPDELVARIREIAPGGSRPAAFEACLRRLVGEIAVPEVLGGFRLEELRAVGNGWQAFRAERNGVPYHLKVIGENMTTLPEDEARQLRAALSDRIHWVAASLADDPRLAARVFRPLQFAPEPFEVEPHLLIAHVWDHGRPLRALPAPLPAPRAAEAVAGLAAAVGELHTGKLVLRYLSPDSAYLCEPPQGAPDGPYYKVSMLEWMRAPNVSTAAVSRLLARDPSPYVAPEIRSEDPHGFGADLYSLAGVAHWLLTGEDPAYARADEHAARSLATAGVPGPLVSLLCAALRPCPARPEWSAAAFAARFASAAG